MERAQDENERDDQTPTWSFSGLVSTEKSRADSGVPHGHAEAGTLHVDREGVWIAREGTPARSAESFPRGAFTRGWFAPAFTERALGLALAGGPRELVTTARFAPWLVLETRDGRRLSVSTHDRAGAYELLDALSLGPSRAALQLDLYTSPAGTGEAPWWSRSREAFRRATAAAASTLTVAATASVVAHSVAGSFAVLGTTVLAGALAARHIRRSAVRLSVEHPAAQLRVTRSGERDILLSVGGIESVRLVRQGFVLDHRDAPRPIAVTVLSAQEASRAIEGEIAPLAKLRLAHAFIDWAQRRAEASVGR
jgi:hypothetical protein